MYDSSHFVTGGEFLFLTLNYHYHYPRHLCTLSLACIKERVRRFESHLRPQACKPNDKNHRCITSRFSSEDGETELSKCRTSVWYGVWCINYYHADRKRWLIIPWKIAKFKYLAIIVWNKNRSQRSWKIRLNSRNVFYHILFLHRQCNIVQRMKNVVYGIEIQTTEREMGFKKEEGGKKGRMILHY